MPNMNGWEFLEYVKTDTNFGHVPVVMVTSLDAERYRDLAARLGASDYIVKPFGAKDLERVLEKFCSVAA
jgi:chemosensory pili system protein ChpA (sensor histidine kinase/response regulator)